ncbi:MAG: asparagine synthase (glutamine-hydrolyzing) [Planctomycetes bacterium]|nr:asparagine synthase (glutamine-hydrolyzing) [Planctomycetota bacterium]
MCGIAGIIDLSGTRQIPPGILQRMADAIVHRGPDEDGYLEEPGIGLANRRLSIVGLHDGKQPIWNEDRSVVTVFNGEFFNYPEAKAHLESKGHVFRTHCDTEVIPHLWEDHQEGMLEHLKGQFGLAVWDRKRQIVVLARDRFGICPLFFSIQGDWLLFGSEIKAILASGMVEAKADLRGIDQAFNFFAVPGPATCFAGVTCLQPGQYLRIPLGEARRGNSRATPERKWYWRIDFPDWGHEDPETDATKLVDEFERVMLGAVERRLRADVPVVSYLSGGIDSSIVVAMAAKIRGQSIPTFTIQIMDPKLDETDQAAVVSKFIGSTPVVVQVGDSEVLESYPELTRAAEAPVIDTSCTALLRLARAVHQNGYKVALTGEGSDEWLAGYPWFKVHKLLGMLDWMPGITPSYWLRRMAMWFAGSPPGSVAAMDKTYETLRTYTAFQDIYGVMGASRLRFYAPETLEKLADYSPYLELEPDLDRMERWHPLNRAFFYSGRIHLGGHLLSLKGDRVAMNSSVETRYPFLDEEVFNFLARIHPSWKMHRFTDKYILRLLCERYLPHEVAWRPKGMFRAPLDSFFDHEVPAFVDQLLSDESLKKTGYFNIEAVKYWRDLSKNDQLGRFKKAPVELGLVAVVATQLWHHQFIDGSLAEISSHASTYRPQPALAAS